ncbi:hypothetical protein [Kitasatospora sp. MAP5-34]|uniref:hypothetical protein n=1 Tax=Kitasatospora sp. MAP5-34 TaxID=3035102 RepID=UPI0024762688|nr:hypothetical protein [Kitasatospora sp. MAP5-34]MDH6576262.1 hypothetical protein [Kitasatospora sp. MAP5-34]
MSARAHSRTAAAIVLTAAVTAGAALLTGCGPTAANAAAPTSAAPSGVSSGLPSAVPSGVPSTKSGAPSATPSTTPRSTPSASTPSPSAPARNGTANSRLTISNGTSRVLMNGTSVDFGTVVRDLAWSPNGSKAAFIDGAGNLDTANPDGSGRVVVAKAPSGQAWSHPTWQVTAVDPVNHVPVKNNIFFAASQGGVSRLEKVLATAVGGTPEALELVQDDGEENPAVLPLVGNSWPNGGGTIGSAVYANTNGNVYIRDENLRQSGAMVTQGSQPALAPDDESVVFVRSVGGHDHIFRGSFDHTAKDLTPHATTDYTEPAWSPDGKTLAVRTPNGVATLPADGSAAPTVVSTFPGLPAYRG